MIEREFYVISLKHSGRREMFLFWRANDAGYTSDLDQAGRYTEEQIAADQRAYNNGTDTIAVACKSVEVLSHRAVSTGFLSALRAAHYISTKEEPAHV